MVFPKSPSSSERVKNPGLRLSKRGSVLFDTTPCSTHSIAGAGTDSDGVRDFWERPRVARILWILLLVQPLLLFSDLVPRKIAAFWDSLTDKHVEDSLIHRTLEMPLNHLGVDVIYYDIQQPLPSIHLQSDCLGVLLCFNDDTRMKDPREFVRWAVAMIDAGKKVVIMGNPGFLTNAKGENTSGDIQNKLFEKLGFVNTQNWVDSPFTYKLTFQDKELTNFERPYPSSLPGFYRCTLFASDTKSYLKAGREGKEESESDLIVIGPRGAYVSQFFANSFDTELFLNNPRGIGWYIDPFAFFTLSFGIQDGPVPDITTLAGKRVFFSTCHGDGWNMQTQVEGYKLQQMSCAEMLLENVIKPHPDVPVTVAVIAATVDPQWVGKTRDQEIASSYFHLPQVEPASHTYSHPFFWDFFRRGGKEKEIDYLYLYPYGSWQNSFLSWYRAKRDQYFKPQEYKKNRLEWGYVIPRAYANQPFDLDKEISGAIDYDNQFAPPENKIKILVWSGDSRPWPEPVILADKAGVKNFGGGFVRFDADYPSLLFVYPLARRPAGIIQPYAAANPDNNYTVGWTDQFYGFQYLPATLKNTGSPRRIKPIHLYYHSYSGEFQESINAISKNIAFIQEVPHISIFTSQFCGIVEGFFSTEIHKEKEKEWRILNRKDLQTVRFDHPSSDVDMAASKGVVGSILTQGSLYIYLDAAEKEPLIVMGSGGPSPLPFLFESSWQVWDVKREQNSFEFRTKGWGLCNMRWSVPVKGKWGITVEDKVIHTLSSDQDLEWSLELPFNQEIVMKVHLQ